MTDWAWPWLLLALPLPWLLRALLAPVANDTGVALRLPFFDEAVRLAGDAAGRGGRWRGPALLIWLLLCLAAARPQWVGEVELPPRSGRDLLLAVDVSGSMGIADMVVGGRAVDRFTAVQLVVGDFLSRRGGDRVGLLLFGSHAYLMTPLTFDHQTVRYQLQTSTVGLAGRETAIGDAIGLSVKRLREQPESQKVLILLTDGVHNAGALKPLEAAGLARDQGLRIYTVGVGGDGRRAGMLGMLMPSEDEIDEPTMIEIAAMTGGRFFRARSTSELAAIYAELDRLEPGIQRGEKLRPRHELYPWPLAAALLLALLWLLLHTRPWRREPA